MKIPVKVPPKVRTLALAVPAALLVAACGAAATNASKSDDATTTGHGSAISPGSPVQPEGLQASAPENLTDLSSTGGAASTAGGSGAADAGAEVEQAADTPAQTRAVISKGKVSLRTTNIEDERFKLKQYLDDWNGSIAEEESDADKGGKSRHAHLELRVPAAKFDTAMEKISTLGTLVDRTRTSQDVTTQVIDNAVRVRTQKLSLARIQALLDRATSLNQIVSIESQLSDRQAQLDSLEQQQKYLADQTAQSTINVYFTVPPEHAIAGKKKQHDEGFLAGLRGGWHNLGEATNTVLHALGGLLPFAAVVVLVVAPLWVARRRRTHVA